MDYHDIRTNLIQVGSKVAYNYSGTIAVGEVVRISEVQKKYWDGTRIFPRFKIKRIFPSPSKFNGEKEFSLVTDRKNLLVLFEGDALY